MLEVLYFSQKDVKARLLERAASAPGLLLVTAVRHSRQMRPVEEREPFRTLERQFGDVLASVVVADDGTAEGMWRDPVGDLADRLFPKDREGAYAAANGYLLLLDGQPEAVLKKSADPVADLWFLQEALAAAHRAIPRPEPSRRPKAPGEKSADSGEAGRGGPRHASAGDAAAARPDSRSRRGARHESDGSAGARPGPASNNTRSNTGQDPAGSSRRRAEGSGTNSGSSDGLAEDPWTLLGVTPGTSLSDARKAFRALVAQYHPDKVSHLAPEFRVLAETRTRQIIAAWEQVAAELE